MPALFGKAPRRLVFSAPRTVCKIATDCNREGCPLGHAGGIPVCQPQAKERRPSACQSQGGMQPCLPLWQASRKRRQGLWGWPEAGLLQAFLLTPHRTSQLGQRGHGCTEAILGQKLLILRNRCAPAWVWRRGFPRNATS